jgi:Rrf2 family protein
MRLEISKRTDQAIRALLVLGERRGDLVSGAELSDRIDATLPYLPQIMKPLISAGWVVSAPGPSGGYRLNGQLSRISVLDVVEVIEGPTDNGRCVLKGAPCQTIRACAMHEAWTRARGALLKELGATPVQADAPLPEREGNDESTQGPGIDATTSSRDRSTHRGDLGDRRVVQRKR